MNLKINMEDIIMRMVDLIIKKRNGEELTKEEIYFMVEGYTDESIPDYQMSAMAMAILFNDMTDVERAHLTMAILKSGDEIDLTSIEGVKVDKHSTGGVGDKTTLVLAPLVASCGVPVAKMSGRGLGHTGGTLDKLESIEGFSISVAEEDFIKQVNEHKLAVIGQTSELCPADKKLYALRDVTGTVESIPLIASSIMSKKLASGADAIVLDVKTGNGAFMKTVEDSVALADAMVRIGKELGRDTSAFITNMNQPLGFAVGNALEVIEAIETLKGNGPKDLVELCLGLGSHMVYHAKKASSIEEAREMLITNIENGQALDRLRAMITSQGGNALVVDDYSLFPKAPIETKVLAPMSGSVSHLEAIQIGNAAMILGAGRPTKESTIDLSVGIVLNKKVGDNVEKGEVLATIYSNGNNTEQAVQETLASYVISEEEVKEPTLIFEVIS
jgi:pyrimidine-nucleoside phosphorylase